MSRARAPDDIGAPGWIPAPPEGYHRPMSGFWAVFWLALVMKIPIALLLYIVRWAVKDPLMAEATDDDEGGSRRHGPGPRRPRPQPPRRGPHGARWRSFWQ